MTTIQEAGSQLRKIRMALNARREAATDPAELDKLGDMVDQVNTALNSLDLRSLEEAAAAVTQATDAVAAFVATARIIRSPRASARACGELRTLRSRSATSCRRLSPPTRPRLPIPINLSRHPMSPRWIHRLPRRS